MLLPHNLRSPTLLLPNLPILQPANLRRLPDLPLLAPIAIPEEIYRLLADTLLPLQIFGRFAVLVLRQTKALASRFGCFFGCFGFRGHVCEDFVAQGFVVGAVTVEAEGAWHCCWLWFGFWTLGDRGWFGSLKAGLVIVEES